MQARIERAGALRRLARTVRFAAASWFRPHAALRARAGVGELGFWVRPRDAIGRHIFRDGLHEPENTAFLLDNLRIGQGEVAVDIGANIGWYSCILDRLAADGASVLAFEPDPDNRALLERNLALNSARRVTVLPLALSHEPGQLTLYRYKQSNLGRHSVLPIHAGEELRIPAVRLDDVLLERGLAGRTLTFLKVDVEGYELRALQGAREALARTRMLMFEYSPAYMRAAGQEPAELFALLEAAGLEPQQLRAGRLDRLDVARVLASDAQLEVFATRRTP